MENHSSYFLGLFITNLIFFFLGFIAGAFYINRNRKSRDNPSFKFFHQDKLYDIKEGLIFLNWSHGDDLQYETYLIRFPDRKFFCIELNNFGCSPEIEELTLEQMKEKLKEMVKYRPEKALSSLKLLETI